MPAVWRYVRHGSMFRVCTIVLAASLCARSHAAAPVPLDQGAAGLQQALARLQTTGSVLHVVAHPDDEDGPMLAYMARRAAARTMLFSITRGEGGANLISSDFFDALGILRTLEHEQAARWYGNELFYSHAVDYGFSKTLEEARRQWQDGEPILRDLVRVIRRERPDVIVSRFRGDARDGHGHHQMAGVISRQAYTVAADPNVFPEQTREGLRPWQPRKLYVGNINPRWRSEDANYATIELQTGEYDPLSGRSYAQIARYGLGYQRSQGISGHEGPAGPSVTRYRLEKSVLGEAAVPEDSFFQGLDVSISGLARFAEDVESASLIDSLARIERAAGQALERFRSESGDACVPPLLDGLTATRRLLDQLASDASDVNLELVLRLKRKEREFEEAIVEALAVDFSATAIADERSADGSPFASSASGFNHAVPGQSLSVEARLVNRSRYAVVPQQIRLQLPEGWTAADAAFERQPLEALQVLAVRVPVDIPVNAEPTRPYWRRDSIAEPFYKVLDPQLAGRPFPPPPVHVVATLQVEGVPVRLEVPVRVALRHPEYGQVDYPLTVVPKLSVRFMNQYGIVPLADRTHHLGVQLHSAAKEGCEGKLRLELPPGWRCTPEEIAFRFTKEDEEGVFTFGVRAPEDLAAGEEVAIHAVATSGGQEFREGYRTITARDLERFNLYKDATHSVRMVDLNLSRDLRIGYVMGSGDEVPKALAAVGLVPTMLDEKELATSDLSRFDTILIGVRAYAVREDLRTHNQRLLDYVYDGGNLIVQYQTPEFDHNFGPYPYRMGRSPEEVSEEDAPVTILEPDHPLFQSPNRITEADFAGWVEQRGSKFWGEWDSQYTPLLECHDTGQPPQRGGMLFATYGEGTYIYSAYAWYRQLPHGVSGAYRIFANMIALGKKGP